MDIEKMQKDVYGETKRLGYEVNLYTTIGKLDEELKELKNCSAGDRRNIYTAGFIQNDADFKSYFENKIKNTVYDEIPDMIFVLMSYCECKNVNIETLMNMKLRYNKLRNKKIDPETNCSNIDCNNNEAGYCIGEECLLNEDR